MRYWGDLIFFQLYNAGASSGGMMQLFLTEDNWIMQLQKNLLTGLVFDNLDFKNGTKLKVVFLELQYFLEKPNAQSERFY